MSYTYDELSLRTSLILIYNDEERHSPVACTLVLFKTLR